MHRRSSVSALALVCFSFGCGGGAGAEEGVTNPADQDRETYETPIGGGAGSELSREGPRGSEEAVAVEPPPTSEEPPKKPPPAVPDPGPPPTETCTVDKDENGFFQRTSPKGPYVGYVPASYSASKAMRVVVGLHGCGGTALNFAEWGVNPYPTRATQQYIGISVGGESGNNSCWSMGVDDDKILAAVEDLAKCFWVDRNKVVIAGFSSGGQLAYRVGMKMAGSFAGILIENSGLYEAGAPVATLIAGAAWKIHVAHLAHKGDGVFPYSKVQADWQSLTNAGFPITTTSREGGHDGDSEDWSGWLLPQAASWARPTP